MYIVASLHCSSPGTARYRTTEDIESQVMYEWSVGTSFLSVRWLPWCGGTNCQQQPHRLRQWQCTATQCRNKPRAKRRSRTIPFHEKAHPAVPCNDMLHLLFRNILNHNLINQCFWPWFAVCWMYFWIGVRNEDDYVHGVTFCGRQSLKKGANCRS